jgi:hypothetical protein
MFAITGYADVKLAIDGKQPTLNSSTDDKGIPPPQAYSSPDGAKQKWPT